MPYSRKPIEVNTTKTFNEWRTEINAAIVKLNELFNASNEFEVHPGGLLNAVTISGSTIGESSTFSNGSIDNTSLTIVTIDNSNIDNSTLNGVTIRNSVLESSNTIQGDILNANITNPTISGGTWSNGAQSGTTMNEISINGFDDNETETVTVSSHTSGSSTVTLTSVPKDLTNARFWYDGKEYTVLSSDGTAVTMEVAEVGVSTTFSGDLILKFGGRSLIRSAKITEPLFSGVVHMDGDDINMIIKYGDSAKRISLAEGVPYELFYDTDLRTVNIFNGTDVGGETVFALPYTTSGDTLPADPYFGQDFFLTVSGVWFKFSGDDNGWQQLT